MTTPISLTLPASSRFKLEDEQELQEILSYSTPLPDLDESSDDDELGGGQDFFGGGDFTPPLSSLTPLSPINKPDLVETRVLDILTSCQKLFEKDRDFDKTLVMINVAYVLAMESQNKRSKEYAIAYKNAFCRKVFWVFKQIFRQKPSENPVRNLKKLKGVLEIPPQNDRSMDKRVVKLNWNVTIAPLLEWAQDPRNPERRTLRNQAILIKLAYLTANASYLPAIDILLKFPKRTDSVRKTLKAFQILQEKSSVRLSLVLSKGRLSEARDNFRRPVFISVTG